MFLPIPPAFAESTLIVFWLINLRLNHIPFGQWLDRMVVIFGASKKNLCPMSSFLYWERSGGKCCDASKSVHIFTFFSQANARHWQSKLRQRCVLHTELTSLKAIEPPLLGQRQLRFEMSTKCLTESEVLQLITKYLHYRMNCLLLGD